MEELLKERYDENNGLWYKLQGNYYYPKYYLGKGLTQEEATKLKEQKELEDTKEDIDENKVILGKYGRARLNYIKQHKKVLYIDLLMNGKLNKHLSEIETIATERIETIINEMAKKDGTNEELKAKDQLEWCGRMNNYKHSAEEIIYNELILN